MAPAVVVSCTEHTHLHAAIIHLAYSQNTSTHCCSITLCTLHISVRVHLLHYVVIIAHALLTNNFELRTCFKGMATHVEPSLELDPNALSDLLCDSVYVTSKPCRYKDVSIKLTEDEKLVCVLSIGAKFIYVIHEFDALSVELRHIQVKGLTKFGNLEEVCDVFIRNNISLYRTYPSFMIIKDVTIIKVYGALFNIPQMYTYKNS